MTESTSQHPSLTAEEQFFSQFEGHIDSPYEPELLRKKRLKAWDHLLELGLPNRADEAFRYVGLNTLYSSSFQKADACELKREDILPLILPEAKGACIVFANGAFRLELSELSALKEAVLVPLTQASRSFATLLQGSWAKNLKEEVDPFACLNNACHHEGVFLYIPPHIKIESHIQLLNIIDSDHPSWVMPRIHIVLGKGSEAIFVDTTTHLNPHVKLFDNQAIDILLEEGAHCSYTQFMESAEGIHFLSIRALLKANAKLSTISVTDGDLARHSIRVQMAGEGADVSLNGVSMLSEKKEGHVHVVVDHQEPNCTSMQRFKNILHDASRSSFEGKIWVRQKAQKTQAYQRNNNLLLSNLAEALSKPNLEIFADDVKASHGSTSGQLDQEQIFYLKTRGLSDDVAKACLIQGFCQELVNTIPNETVREKAHRRILSLYGSDR